MYTCILRFNFFNLIFLNSYEVLQYKSFFYSFSFLMFTTEISIPIFNINNAVIPGILHKNILFFFILTSVRLFVKL